MPSVQARLCSALSRVQSFLFWRPRKVMWELPGAVKMQRWVFSNIAPMFIPPARGIDFRGFEIDGIPAAWLIPVGADDDRVILYLHGGGWVVGSIKSHRKMVGRIAAEAGCRALMIDYRLAPEHPFPAGLEDCHRAYTWLLEQGYDPAKIVIAGDSAGGGLTLSTMLAARDAGQSLPAAGVCMSPGTDCANTGESWKTNARRDPLICEGIGALWIGMYLSGCDACDPLASPLYADLSGLPPLLIQVGTREVLLDDSTRLADLAEREGVQVELEVWDGMWHVWQFFCPIMPESTDAIRKIGRFCREKTTGRSPVPA